MVALKREFASSRAKRISETMRRRKVDNFFQWREEMKRTGLIKTSYDPFPKSDELAELIGVTLGDGNIEVFPRTERLVIAANSRNKGFVKRYEGIVGRIFGKKPKCMKSRSANCVRISIYQKFISERLGIQSGNRKNARYVVPGWILRNTTFKISFLRGLYEAEGSLCVHKATSTYKLLFSNKNMSLLNIVSDALASLGFKSNKSGYKVQVSRKDEVYQLKKLIGFRVYDRL